MKKELTCIGCPMGCAITVTMSGNEITKIEGYGCKNGEKYARKEVTNPTRIVTGSVPVEGSKKCLMVSVKTETDVPKDKIFECMESIKNIKVKAPVKIGDVIVKNVAGTGVDIIATRNA